MTNPNNPREIHLAPSPSAAGCMKTALNGIDDWVGGVHLDSSEGWVWFRRDDTLVRAAV